MSKTAEEFAPPLEPVKLIVALAPPVIEVVAIPDNSYLALLSAGN